MNGSKKPQIDTLIQNIDALIEHCWFYGLKSVLMSGLLYTTRVKLMTLEEAYKRSEVLFCNNNIILIDNRNIGIAICKRQSTTFIIWKKKS